MNYNNKKHDLEIDEFDIKAHLNTSLDLSGISVSEDLIHRTLAAIKASEQEKASMETVSEENDTIGKRVIPFSRYIRGIAGVAAALFIVIVGYSVLKSVNYKSNKTDSGAPEIAYNTTADMAAGENSTMSMAESTAAAPAESETAGYGSDNRGASDDSVAIAEEAKQEEALYSITTQTDSVDGESDGASGEGMDGSTNNIAPADQSNLNLGASFAASKDTDMAVKSAEIIELSFRDIFLPDVTKAEYITIKNVTDGTDITLTDQTQIEEFYTMMDIHQFISVSDTNREPDYSVETRELESGVLYTMLIGDYIEITCYDGETVSFSVYQALDNTLLKQNLDEFYKKQISQ